MTSVKIRSQLKTAKWGWGVLLALSAILILNGVIWFFVGGSLPTFEQDVGVSLDEFRQAYPTVADYAATQTRQVAIWFVAVGLLALSVTRQGFRHHSRWAWNSAWILVGALAVVGINALARGELPYGSLMVVLSAIALVGQLLTREELAS
ncbi:MAG: hypothetical protein PVG32_19910 [Anaerolineales bacterium]|jgi:hypothetical protein